jgi:multidrug efflux pump subunit AcrB
MRDGSGAIIFYPSVTIGIQSKPSTDALELYDTVTEKIESLKRNAASTDTRVTISADFAEGIRSQIAGLQQSLFEGLIVVILVSCLLISFRAGIVTALSMATVLLATISILYASGITLNTITLFGLILSLGLIVDDTTIMVEAIDAAKNTKKDQRTIVSLAIKKVARASFAGTLTTMLAFSPMLFISGILGDFIRILPITIIIALFASLLVSLTLVPFLARFLLGKKHYTDLKNPVLIAESYVSTKLSSAVAAGASSRKKRYLYGGASVLFSTVLFVSSVPLFAKLKFDIFPNTKDSDAISVTLRYKDGTSLETAAAIADKANTIIGDNLGKNIKRVTYENTGTPSTATARIDLVSYKDREQKSPEFISKLQEAFKDFGLASVKVGQIDVGPPKDDFPFNVRIVDSDIEKASRLARDMREHLLGKTVTRANGTTATVVRAEVSHSDTLRRDNGNAYVSVSAGFDASDTSALVGATEKIVKDTYTATKLAQYNISKDQLVFDFGNESNNQDSFKSMLIAFPVLLLFMYVLLALQFRSFLQPLLIFMAIPFSFFGVAAGLYITNNPLSFFVMIGFFALIGIAVNNTILLTDYANQARDEGSSAYEAMALAIKARFRPLVTTSLTSVVALLPLALSDPFWESLSYTLIFGLLSSTLLVVVGFPYYYLIGEWLRMIGSKVWKREMPRWLQIPFDILISPIRVVRFLSWIVFSWRS